jgi:hypothetical protein
MPENEELYITSQKASESLLGAKEIHVSSHNLHFLLFIARMPLG